MSFNVSLLLPYPKLSVHVRIPKRWLMVCLFRHNEVLVDGIHGTQSVHQGPCAYASRYIMASFRPGCSELLQVLDSQWYCLLRYCAEALLFPVPFPAICPRTVETRHLRHSCKLSDVGLEAARAIWLFPMDFRFSWVRSPMRGKEGFALLAETPERRVPNPRVLSSNDGRSLTITKGNDEKKAKEILHLLSSQVLADGLEEMVSLAVRKYA